MSTLRLQRLLPLKNTCPSVGSSKTFKHRKKVLFPLPDGPIIAIFSPVDILAETSSNTVNAPYFFVRCWTSISAFGSKGSAGVVSVLKNFSFLLRLCFAVFFLAFFTLFQPPFNQADNDSHNKDNYEVAKSKHKIRDHIFVFCAGD